MAVAVRSHRFGFVVFEGTHILDSGVRACPWSVLSAVSILRTKAAKIMHRYCPTAVLIGEPSRNAVAKRTVAAFRSESRRRSIAVQCVSRNAVERFFGERGASTKHQTAVLLAEWFTDLAWKLPQKRRLWENEPDNIILFDAVANGIAFLAET
jgi:hypothetical protein